MVHGNAVFIRKEAKPARNTHWYAFSTRKFTSFNSVNFPERKVNYTVDVVDKWNNIPQEVASAPSATSFKLRLKKLLYV